MINILKALFFLAYFGGMLTMVRFVAGCDGKILNQNYQYAQNQLIKIPEEKVSEMKEFVDFSLKDKIFTQEKDGKYLTYKFLIENKSSKITRNIEGYAFFYDSEGELIDTYSFFTHKRLLPKSRLTYVVHREYFRYNAQLTKVKKLDASKIYMEWHPIKITYCDDFDLQRCMGLP